MIQDIQPKQYHNEYTPRPIRENDIVFVFRGREVLLRTEADGKFSFPTGKETAEENLQYLFSIDDRAFFLGREPVASYDFQPMRLLRKCTPQDLCFAGMTAWHLYNWYRDNHVFVEGDVYEITLQTLDLTDKDISVAYYDELQAKLPDCGIRWLVPFHGGKYANDTDSLTVSDLTLEDVEFLTKYFPNLKKLDASQCHDYDALAVAEAAWPTEVGSLRFISVAAAAMVRLMLVPVSPSGTGKTLRSLIFCFCRAMAAEPCSTICLN